MRAALSAASSGWRGSPQGDDMMTCAVHDNPLEPLDLRDWSGKCSLEDREHALHGLESGKIVFLPHLLFDLTPSDVSSIRSCRTARPRT
jgi:hypothetical protein